MTDSKFSLEINGTLYELTTHKWGFVAVDEVGTGRCWYTQDLYNGDTPDLATMFDEYSVDNFIRYIADNYI